MKVFRYSCIDLGERMFSNYTASTARDARYWYVG